VERVPAYLGSVVTLTILAVVALGLGWVGPGLEALGLGGAGALEWSADWASSGWVVLGILALAVAGVGGAFHLAGRWLGLEESPLLRELIPRTGREKRLFVVLSLAAGIGEEVVYRGYLLAVLAPVFNGPWTAALVSSMAFSVLHAYQGPVGLVRSGLLGFLFAAAFIVHGSLWPVMAVHVGVDLVSGLLLGPRMLAGEEPGEDRPVHSTQGES
jgi:membrane protease YdiL (CAAX protease family)